MNVSKILFTALAALLAAAPLCRAQVDKPPSRDILQTPHNLSVTGGGGAHDIKSSTETRVCIFCHTPHHATSVTPLWSREISKLTIYVPYKSGTIKANPQQPRGASRLCLSCHDGTIAIGMLAGGKDLDPTLRSFREMTLSTDPRKNPNLGVDLSDDHPISFSYPYGANMELRDPALLKAEGIKLEQGNFVECTACHDPHNNQYNNFLVKDVSVQHDALCTTCHNKAGWSEADAVHRTGGTRFSEVSSQVAAEGCVACHMPHNAQKGEHLLKLASAGAGEETNCYLSCHRDVPYTNVWSQFNDQLYTHPIKSATDVHKANEALPVTGEREHVECVDCHNPHQTGWEGAPLGNPFPTVQPASGAPNVNGPLRGVRGVDYTGSGVVPVARYEYEICFRCHAGASAGSFTTVATQLPDRVFKDFDESNRFNPSNPSYHPVTAERRQGTAGRSLRTEYQAKMFWIYCNDCHNSHGSNILHMLRDQNADTFPAAAPYNYPLCFRCHDPDYLLNPAASPRSASVLLHQKHVLGPHDNGDTRLTPCSVCHDPHGVPGSRTANSINGAHLMNFDRRYAGPTAAYDSSALSCTVSCHSTNPRTYQLQ